MKMIGGSFNLYYKHEQLTPHNVRMATYGTDESSGGLLPEVGDVISDFPGEMSAPIRVRVTAVEPLGTRGEAYQVTVATVEAAGPMTADNLDELLGDLFDYGGQEAYGVVCDGGPEFTRAWGFLDATLADAQRQAAALAERHGVPFRAVTMIIDAKIIDSGTEG